MHLFHAVTYFYRESRRQRALENAAAVRKGHRKGSEWFYWTRFIPMLVKFLRLELELERRSMGFSRPVKHWNTNPRKGGRKKKRK